MSKAVTDRLTIELDEDVARRLEAEASRRGASPHDVLNDTLRQALKERDAARTPFLAPAYRLGDVNVDNAWEILDAADREQFDHRDEP